MSKDAEEHPRVLDTKSGRVALRDNKRDEAALSLLDRPFHIIWEREVYSREARNRTLNFLDGTSLVAREAELQSTLANR